MSEEAVEASEIGLAPGRWPLFITYDGAEFSREQVFFDADGDITHVNYRGRHVSRQLVVFND